MQNKEFEEWFNQVENFGLKSERFYDDILMCMTCGEDSRYAFDYMVKWMKAAFEAGKNSKDVQ